MRLVPHVYLHRLASSLHHATSATCVPVPTLSSQLSDRVQHPRRAWIQFALLPTSTLSSLTRTPSTGRQEMRLDWCYSSTQPDLLRRRYTSPQSTDNDFCRPDKQKVPLTFSSFLSLTVAETSQWPRAHTHPLPHTHHTQAAMDVGSLLPRFVNTVLSMSRPQSSCCPGTTTLSNKHHRTTHSLQCYDNTTEYSQTHHGAMVTPQNTVKLTTELWLHHRIQSNSPRSYGNTTKYSQTHHGAMVIPQN